MIYSGFGLHIESEVELDLPASASGTKPSVAIHFSDRTVHGPDWIPVRSESATALIAADGSQVWLRPDSGFSMDERKSFLQGMVMLQLLAVRGIVCFHGSGVAMGHNGIGFIGPSRIGKSTLAIAMIKSGCSFLGDDMLPIKVDKGIALVFPTASGIRMWKDTMQHFGFDPRSSMRASGTKEKYLVAKESYCERVVSHPVPLRLMYILCDTDQPETQSKPEELFGLLQLTLRPQFMNGEMHQDLLSALAFLVRTITIKNLFVPRDFSALDSLVARVMEDYSRLAEGL